MAEKESNKPVAREKAGLVEVSTWENKATTKDGKEFEYKNHNVQRSYKDGEEWKSTTSFRTQDIPRLIACLRRTYDREVFNETEEQVSE